MYILGSTRGRKVANAYFSEVLYQNEPVDQSLLFLNNDLAKIIS